MARRRLSQRQIERIRCAQERRRQRLAERSAREFLPTDDGDVREGLVVTRHGVHLAVMDAKGHIYHCLARQHIGQAVCGDRVVWQPTSAEQGIVSALLPRRSVLSRPDYSGRDKALAANITQLVVVLAPLPEPNDYLLDQYLVAAEHAEATALVALNKTDLLANGKAEDFSIRFARYQRIGYRLVPVSARQEHGLDRLVEALRGQTSILVGQSGVGKSSLVQALLPDLEVQIGRLSDTTGMGRHTTSATTWYRLPESGALIDSPGVRSFRLGQLDLAQLERGFREFRPYHGHCQFADCRHDQEPGCAIKQAVDSGRIHPQRLRNFHHMAAQLSVRI